MNYAKKLLLFDIDGTLIWSGGAGEAAVRMAVKERFGIEDDLARVEFAGSTDGKIARDILDLFHIEPTPDHIAGLLDSYLSFLPKFLSEKSGLLLPGIRDLLDRLAERPDVVLALLTGNQARGAEIKLTHYGVWHYFEFGAYSDDHHDRNELGAFARSRARERHGVEFPAENIFVIGDTPKDIACGRAIGAKTVAFATGRFSAAELADHQPDFLFESCRDPDRVIRELGW